MHTDDPPTIAPPLLDCYRLVRALTASESPFAGVLARTDDERSVVLVPADALDGWPGWQADPGGHVLAVQDVARTRDGLLAELPWCTETVDAFLARRVDGAAALSSGEAVTLAISMLRALSELGVGRSRRDGAAGGRWWLTDSGKPLFALDVMASVSWVESTGRTLESLRDACADDRVAEILADIASDVPAAVRACERTEDRLFALADALPLGVSEAGWERTAAPPRPVTSIEPLEDEPPRGLRGLVAQHLDMDIARVAAAAIDRLRPRRRLATRVGPVVAGGLVAATAVVGGLMWPGGQAERADAGASPSTAAEPTATAPTVSPPTASPPDSEAGETTAVRPGSADDALAAARQIVSALAGCVDEPCRAALAETTDAMPARVHDGEVTLLDDFGDVSVFRVESATAGAAPQHLVLARDDDGWRVRAVYDAQEGAG